MSTASKVTWTLGTIVSLILILGALYKTYDHLATDFELIAVAVAAETATKKVAEIHQADKVTQMEARKNDRVDRVNRDIVKQQRLLREELSLEDRLVEEEVLADMKTLKQNIIEEKR